MLAITGAVLMTRYDLQPARLHALYGFSAIVAVGILYSYGDPPAGRRAEVDRGVGRGGAQDDRIGAGAADQRGDVLEDPGVGGVGEAQLVRPAAKVDRDGGGQRGAEGDCVGARAAGDGLGVGDGCCVGEIAEGQDVVAGAQVDRGVGRGGAEDDRIGAGPTDQGIVVSQPLTWTLNK